MGMTKTLRKKNDRFGSVTTLIHGEYGVGKTTLVSQYPKPYFIMCENNNAYQDRLYMDNATSWGQCNELIQEFLVGDHDKLTLVIDNGSEFYKLAVVHFLTEHNKTLKSTEKPAISLTDISYGKAYEAVDNMIKSTLNPVDRDDRFNLIIVTHSEVQELEAMGNPIYKMCPQLPGKRPREYFFTLARNIFYYYYSGKKRYLKISGDDFVLAKNNSSDHFKTTEGKSIINIPMGDTDEKEAFKYLYAAYNNKLKNTYESIK